MPLANVFPRPDDSKPTHDEIRALFGVRRGCSLDLASCGKFTWAWNIESVSTHGKLMLIVLSEITDQDGIWFGPPERIQRITRMSGFIVKQTLNRLASLGFVEIRSLSAYPGKYGLRIRLIETQPESRVA